MIFSPFGTPITGFKVMIHGDYNGEEVKRSFDDIEAIMKPYGTLYINEEDTASGKFRSYSVDTHTSPQSS